MRAEIHSLLTTTPPTFTPADAVLIAADYFDICAQAKLLDSERDQNFHLEGDNDQRYTLKFANHAEQLSTIEFQSGALRHIATQDATIPVPRVIPNRNGQLHCKLERDGKTHMVRLFSWLDGTPLHETTNDPLLADTIGKLLARLGQALQGFDHPGSNPPLLWDMKHASGLRELLLNTEDSDLRQSIEHTLDRFDNHVQAKLLVLRTQVIHNDLNPDNILLDKTNLHRISGIIDFGDLVKSPLIIDLAVAAAYQLASTDDPLAGALPVIAGYHSVCPLQDAEMDLLVDLIRTRLVTTLVIMAYRTKLFPHNRQYLMISYESARRHLLNFTQLSTDEARQRIDKACNVDHRQKTD